MSILSIIKKTLSIKGFKLANARLLFEKLLLITILPRKGSQPVCPVCGRRGPTYDTLPRRYWSHLEGFGFHVMIDYAPRRVTCRRCHKIRVERMPWNIGKCHLTRPLIYKLALWARELSWTQVAQLFEVDWSQVQMAVKVAVDYGLAHRDTDDVKLLGIDEISRRKGHTYLTQVYEIEAGKRRLLWSGDGRSEAALADFFEAWGKERCKQIKGICVDMWEPYVSVIERYAPDAVLVFDRFHIVKHLNDALDQVRREEAHGAQKEALKESRYVFLKHPENLTVKQKLRWELIMGRSLKTVRAYHLKEGFRTFWEASDADDARKVFKVWFNWATHSRLKPFSKIAWTLKERLDQIVSCFDMPINNSIVEGLNNKAKVIMRRSFGYRTPQVCRYALLHCLGDLPLPDP